MLKGKGQNSDLRSRIPSHTQVSHSTNALAVHAFLVLLHSMYLSSFLSPPITVAPLLQTSISAMSASESPAQVVSDAVKIDVEAAIQHPPSFVCPISCQVMHDPMVLCDGHTYEKRHIERWLDFNNTSPVTGSELPSKVFFPNHALRNAIEEYFRELFSTHKRAIRKAAVPHLGSKGKTTSFGSNQSLLRTMESLMETAVLVNSDLSVEHCLRRIVDEAKELIGAEVASVFLVDHKRQQLFSTVNSTGGEIRMPIAAGIAGSVASSGEPLVITDAYSDDRFNKKVDLETGFTTRGILCVPIKSTKGEVLGVVQLINKVPGGVVQQDDDGDDTDSGHLNFTVDDQRFLLVFASQAAVTVANSSGSFGAEEEEAVPPVDSGDPAKVSKPPSPEADLAKAAVSELLKEAFSGFEANVLLLGQLTDGKPLSTLGCHLFEQLGLVEAFGMDRAKLAAFLCQVEKGYDDENPYHNRAHAASVLHMTHALLLHGGVAQAVGLGNWFGNEGGEAVREAGRFETLACLLAAACHDFEHQGLNNQFLVRTHDPLAVRYNDQHVNENHHVSGAFRLLLDPAYNFLEAMPLAEFKRLRQLVIDLVLGTDMSEDKEIVGTLAAKLKERKEVAAEGTAACAAPFVPTSKAEAVLALQMALKAADIGHLALPWRCHLVWVERLEMEFFAQGDLERALGLPISFLMDREKPGVTQTQLGFFAFVVDPLFDALVEAFPGAGPMAAAVASNKAQWKALDDAKKAREAAEVAEAAGPAATASVKA